MSDKAADAGTEEKMIPKSEFDRRLAAAKAREDALSAELGNLRARIGELEPIAARAEEAEGRVRAMEQRQARDEVWRGVGDLDPSLRDRLERLYDLDPPKGQDGEAIPFDLWVTDRSDPVLGALLPPPAPAGDGASEQGAQPAPTSAPAAPPLRRGTPGGTAGRSPTPQGAPTPEQAAAHHRALISQGKIDEARAYRREHMGQG